MGRGVLQSSRRGAGLSHPDAVAALGWNGLASGFPHPPLAVRGATALLIVSDMSLGWDGEYLALYDEVPLCWIFSRM